ncbi:hypothetical protein GUJ93_ZPchr0012g19762 [Zizania palustris]|uniref:Uncharacterized protein n=1 Tax=Zizania palustris TaxID=103762 RepID=A0A8J5WKD8_ZIZPA|nr:hypothetical protein GUJ93_ZPchr0012g19762 [Zizania palustris]
MWRLKTLPGANKTSCQFPEQEAAWRLSVCIGGYAAAAAAADQLHVCRHMPLSTFSEAAIPKACSGSRLREPSLLYQSTCGACPPARFLPRAVAPPARRSGPAFSRVVTVFTFLK